MTKNDIREIWQRAGGVLQGAPTYVAVMPEEKMLALMQTLLKTNGEAGYTEAQISLACGMAGFPFQALEALIKVLKSL